MTNRICDICKRKTEEYDLDFEYFAPLKSFLESGNIDCGAFHKVLGDVVSSFLPKDCTVVGFSYEKQLFSYTLSVKTPDNNEFFVGFMCRDYLGLYPTRVLGHYLTGNSSIRVSMFIVTDNKVFNTSLFSLKEDISFVEFVCYKCNSLPESLSPYYHKIISGQFDNVRLEEFEFEAFGEAYKTAVEELLPDGYVITHYTVFNRVNSIMWTVKAPNGKDFVCFFNNYGDCSWLTNVVIEFNDKCCYTPLLSLADTIKGIEEV